MKSIILLFILSYYISRKLSFGWFSSILIQLNWKIIFIHLLHSYEIDTYKICTRTYSFPLIFQLLVAFQQINAYFALSGQPSLAKVTPLAEEDPSFRFYPGFGVTTKKLNILNSQAPSRCKTWSGSAGLNQASCSVLLSADCRI